MKQWITCFGALCILLLAACKKETAPSISFDINTRLKSDPQNLNPYTTASGDAHNVYRFIFQTLAEYDPYTLELQPVLITALPRAEAVDTGAYAGEVVYQFEIKPEARWSDGQAVTAADYLFSVKLCLLPTLAESGFSPYVNTIKALTLMEESPSKFKVTADKEYILSLPSLTNIPILPKHVYDPGGVLDSFSFEQIRYHEDLQLDLINHPSLLSFTDQFKQATYGRDKLIGSGAYTVSQWETNQTIVLEKINGWWGEAWSAQSTLLQANPQRIILKVIPDEAAALTALKEGNLDILPTANSLNFDQMSKDTAFNLKYNFLSAPQLTYLYIAMNNQHPALKSLKVRQALARLMDVDEMQKSLMLGYGQRVTGPVNPLKSYYNRSLTPIPYQLDSAKLLLAADGWADANKNGILDKTIDGRLQELNLRIMVTQAELGRKTAILFKENAAKAGVNLEIVALANFQEIRTKHLNTGDYELTTVANSISVPVDYDPYQQWHTQSYQTKAGNFAGFGDVESDRLIEELRVEVDPQKRHDLYQEFQAMVYAQQPVIFLVSPMQLVMVSKKLEAKASALAPGYHENTYRLASAAVLN